MDMIGPLFCKVCNVAIPHENARESHNQGKRHQQLLHLALTEDNDEKASVFSIGWPNAINKDEILNFMASYGTVKSHFLSTKGMWMITKYEDIKVAQSVIEKGHVQFYGKWITFSAKKKNTAQQHPQPQQEHDFEPILKIISNQKSFGDEVVTLSCILQPNPNLDIQKYLHLCNDLEGSISSLYPHAKVHPFGSTITGLAFRDSDVDAYIEVPNPPRYRNKIFYVEAVNKTRDLLFHNQLFTNIVAIPRAKTPIVKCVHGPTGLKCDFNFKNMLGVCNSYFIQFIVRLDPKLKMCLLVLKFWSKLRVICGSNSRLTNYALTIMFIYYLQQEPYNLPSIMKLQENVAFKNIQYGWNGGFDRSYPIDLTAIREASLYELLLGFFTLYSKINYNDLVICPYLGKTIEKSCFANIEVLPPEFQLYRVSYRDEHLKADTPMCVQDPFEHNHNLTTALSRKFLDEFLNEIRIACNTFEAQKPHLLYNLCSDIMEEKTQYSVKAKMPKVKALQFLDVELPSDNPQRSYELKILWFQLVDTFLMDVLTDVYKFSLSVNDSLKNPKKMKPDVLTNLYDTLQFTAVGSFNTWDARSVIKDLTMPPECNTFMQRQVEISKYILNTLLKDVTPSKPLLNVSFTVEHYIVDAHVVIAVECGEGESGFFKSFAACLTKSFPSWLLCYTQERNKEFSVQESAADDDAVANDGKSENIVDLTEDVH